MLLCGPSAGRIPQDAGRFASGLRTTSVPEKWFRYLMRPETMSAGIADARRRAAMSRICSSVVPAGRSSTYSLRSSVYVVVYRGSPMLLPRSFLSL